MKKLMVIIFVLFLAVPGLWITVEGLTGNAEVFSDAEQRMLTEFPSEITWDNLDSFADQVEDYINDHAPYRDELVAFNAGLDYHLFHATDTPSVILGKNGWLFYAGQNSAEDFRGLGGRTEEWHQEVAALVNAVNAGLEAQGIEFIILLAPNKERIYQEYMPDYMEIVNEKNRLDVLADYLRESTSVPVVYPKECFEDKSYQWYYKTDTHWNNAGGFLAGQELIEALGGTVTDISEVDVTYTPRGTGDLVRMAHLPSEDFDETEALVNGYLPETELTMVEDTGYYPTLKFYTSKNAPDPRHVVIYRDSFTDAINATMSRYFARVDTYWWDSGAEAKMGEEKPDVVVYEILERYIDERILDDLQTLSQVWQ
ncbi:MAG: alginate O-acetyltransferase [Lachnospiraceae bacterium]|jgi:hypothetical protein|nr:alginate O-acetyltransferase [Lachnospiraceae bacterium]